MDKYMINHEMFQSLGNILLQYGIDAAKFYELLTWCMGDEIQELIGKEETGKLFDAILGVGNYWLSKGEVEE